MTAFAYSKGGKAFSLYYIFDVNFDVKFCFKWKVFCINAGKKWRYLLCKTFHNRLEWTVPHFVIKCTNFLPLFSFTIFYSFLGQLLTNLITNKKHDSWWLCSLCKVGQRLLCVLQCHWLATFGLRNFNFCKHTLIDS